MRLAGGSCSGLDLCQAAPTQEKAQERDGGAGVREGACSLAAAAGGGVGGQGSKSAEHFPNSHCIGLGGAPLSLLREGDYWSELQSMLNMANCWPEGARRGQVRSRGPGIGLELAAQPGPESPDPPVGSPVDRGPWPVLAAVLLLQRARGRLLPLCPRRLGQVEISPFKPARANQNPARRRFKHALHPASRLAAETLARGRVNLLPRLLGATQTPRVTGALALARPERSRGHGALLAPRLPREPARPAGLVLLSHHLW